MIIEKFDASLFLKEYWQKKPCLIKNFHPDFIDPIDENDLAGLAQEPEVDSRVVSQENGKWQVSQGPFEDFSEVCQGKWSLLVQGVDRYIQEVSDLSALVSFVPNWRFDDVMVSFSVPQAGVGAHTDEYDVFILQGKGSRRWQVGLPLSNQNASDSISPHPLLNLVKDFSPVIDYELSPGDAIYIPPKHPHKGEALTDCLNYSLGFRAPTDLEALLGILDESEELEATQRRYTDSDIQNLRSDNHLASEVSKLEISAIKQNVLALLDSELAEQAILQFLSRQNLPDFSATPAFTSQDVAMHIQQNAKFVKAPGVKPIFTQSSSPVFSFFIDGNMFCVDSTLRLETIKLLEADYISSRPPSIEDQSMTKGKAQTTHPDMSWSNLLTQLVNAGYWEIQA